MITGIILSLLSLNIQLPNPISDQSIPIEIHTEIPNPISDQNIPIEIHTQISRTHAKDGNTLADIYQGKNSLPIILLYPEGEVVLSLFAADNQIVYGPTTHTSPSSLQLPMTGIPPGKYQLEVIYGTQRQELEVDWQH